jgi:5-methylcytosine-specific restriction protein A
MPWRPHKPCAVADCPELVPPGVTYCDTHAKPRGAGEDRGGPRERGYDRVWERVARRYLAAHPVCEACEEQGRTALAVLVHHVVPLCDGGARLDTRNMRALCGECHGGAHARLRRGRAGP